MHGYTFAADPRTLPEWHSAVTIPLWLQERDYTDCLAALEAGETGPDGAGGGVQGTGRRDTAALAAMIAKLEASG
jgi:hypothetical protein